MGERRLLVGVAGAAAGIFPRRRRPTADAAGRALVAAVHRAPAAGRAPQRGVFVVLLRPGPSLPGFRSGFAVFLQGVQVSVHEPLRYELGVVKGALDGSVEFALETFERTVQLGQKLVHDVNAVEQGVVTHARTPARPELGHDRAEPLLHLVLLPIRRFLRGSVRRHLLSARARQHDPRPAVREVARGARDEPRVVPRLVPAEPRGVPLEYLVGQRPQETVCRIQAQVLVARPLPVPVVVRTREPLRHLDE